ncbi:uncharacterized protein [Panulirus ornatus]|uniref:uncharacterized protein n=1 Tax=Panulirus ornatus TaxID=150431 RepID=UPI003A864460
MAAFKLVLAALVVTVAVSVASGEHLAHFLAKRAILLDDNFTPVAAVAPNLRHRRDTSYAAPPVHKGYSKGRVGPVYTFVKTDYNGNFKWGVRHRAGSQYGGGYH